MPTEIASPVMPTEISNPLVPDWKTKCPKYGGDELKQKEWIDAAQAKWDKANIDAMEKWQASALEVRAKFVESAALRAESGHVKMIGLSVSGERTVYVWERDRKVVDLAAKEASAAKIALFCPSMKEEEMLTRFAKDFIPMIANEPDYGRVITFYGHTFDIPFLARRAAICGDASLLKLLRQHRRGRYFDPRHFVDLQEEWTLGDRETKTGGLEGLARILGIDLQKNRDASTFYHWWKTDPAEGVRYLLNDLSMTEQCAKRMGML